MHFATSNFYFKPRLSRCLFKPKRSHENIPGPLDASPPYTSQSRKQQWASTAKYRMAGKDFFLKTICSQKRRTADAATPLCCELLFFKWSFCMSCEFRSGMQVFRLFWLIAGESIGFVNNFRFTLSRQRLVLDRGTGVCRWATGT